MKFINLGLTAKRLSKLSKYEEDLKLHLPESSDSEKDEDEQASDKAKVLRVAISIVLVNDVTNIRISPE